MRMRNVEKFASMRFYMPPLFRKKRMVVAEKRTVCDTLQVFIFLNLKSNLFSTPYLHNSDAPWLP